MTYEQMIEPLAEFKPQVEVLLWGDTDRPIISYYALCGKKFEDWIPIFSALIIANFNCFRWN